MPGWLLDTCPLMQFSKHSGFKSIPSVMFVYQPSTTGDPGQYEQKSKILTKPYSQRLEGIEEIYSRATTASHAKGTVATISDLLALLSSIDPQAYFRVYSDLKYSEEALSSDPLYTLAVVSNSIVDIAKFMDNINSWKTAVDVSKNIQIVPALPSSPAITLYAKATSPINVLTNETLANLTSSYKSMIGESLHHSKIEADIVRLGFDHVILYLFRSVIEAGRLFTNVEAHLAIRVDEGFDGRIVHPFPLIGNAILGVVDVLDFLLTVSRYRAHSDFCDLCFCCSTSHKEQGC